MEKDKFTEIFGLALFGSILLLCSYFILSLSVLCIFSGKIMGQVNGVLLLTLAVILTFQVPTGVVNFFKGKEI